jgi:hypothetical protein
MRVSEVDDWEYRADYYLSMGTDGRHHVMRVIAWGAMCIPTSR